MSPPALALVVAAVLAAAGACTRGMNVRATVTSTAGPPLASVAILMSCPQVFKGNGRSLLGETDRGGVMHHREHPWGRWIHDRCDLLIEKRGFETRRIPVVAVCGEYDQNHCVRVDLFVELAPAPADRCAP